MSHIPSIVAGLREIGWLLSLRQEDFFRSRAYKKAAEALARYDGDLEPLIESGRLTEVPGVGKSTARIIGELHQTGRARLLSELRKAFPRDVARLARIPGLGLSRLQQLHAELGIETAEDLRNACASGAVAGVKGFGPKTVQKVVQALDQARATPALLLLPHARTLAAELSTLWQPHLGTALHPTGAIRRCEPGIAEIELLGVRTGSGDGLPPSPKLPRAGDLTPVASEVAVPGLIGGTTRLRDGAPVRIWLAPEPQQGLALLATTGPSSLARALLRSAVPGDNEAQLFHRAGLTPWPPEVRDLWSDRAEPPQLVQREDLRGLVHAHTTRSDGRDGLAAMAHGARALGYSYLTVTDHSPSAKYAGGLSLAELDEQGEEARRVEAEADIRILLGTESDIQRAGGLDHPLERLEALDIVIASIHGRFRLDEAAMTERLLRTFDLPLRLIWGHPLGRLVLTRPPIEADLPRVFDRLAERGHILEVNGDPHRMDLPPAWIREAKQRGLKFVVSADAHSVRGLSMAETALDCARAGGLEAGDILNTLDADAFADAVRPSLP